MIFAAVLTGWRMCAAPPLLVAFTEFSRRGSRSHVHHPAADVEDEAVPSAGRGHGYPADISAGGVGEVIRHSGVHRRFDIYGIGAAALPQRR